MPGELTTAIGAIGDPEGVRELGLEGMPGVDQVVPISRPYKLASRELSHHEPTDVRGRRPDGRRRLDLLPDRRPVHGRDPRADARASPRGRATGGASMLRGGAFKPRTSPFSFQGSGVDGARDPARGARGDRAADRHRADSTSQHAEAVAEVADVIQVGARNMQNYALLEVVGKLGKPVLLKRGLSSTLDELLQAADYVLKEGNDAA